MLIYQYFPRWKGFLLAECIGAALLAFIGEPVAEMMSMYKALHWYHYWSFPIYVAKSAIGKLLIDYLVSKR